MSPFVLPRAITPFVAPPGFPPDVAPNQIIFASHINVIRDSVAIWPGNVNANAKNLTGVAAITGTGVAQMGSFRAERAFPQIEFRDTGVSVVAGGLARFAGDSAGTFVWQINTAGAGNYSTLIPALAITKFGRIGIGRVDPRTTVEIYDPSPYLSFTDWDSAADAKVWDFFMSPNTFDFRTANDAYSATNIIWRVTRSGLTPTRFSFQLASPAKVGIPNIGVYATNAAALAAGLIGGDLYVKTGTDPLQVCMAYNP